MIKVGNNYILNDTKEILLELKAQLKLNGIDVFHKFIDTNSNIQTTCPFHKNGQEHKPSFGILTRDSGEYKAGMCHCFTCGWSGMLDEMISNLFGYDDLGIFGEKWLVKNFLVTSVQNRKDIDIDTERVKTKSVSYISDDELDNYRYIHPYMYKRKMTDEMIELFDIGYDKATDCLTFPVRDERGNCLFVARRSVKSKYFNYPNNVEKPIYGLYELSFLDKFPNEIVVCESMINCITSWVYGRPAVALNGTGSIAQYKKLSTLPCRKLVLGLDADEAGNKGCERIKYNVTNKLLSRLILPSGKDINDLTEIEFKNLKEFIF